MKETNSETLKIGDMVSWKSQANGSFKTKTGEIVQIVIPGRLPDREQYIQLYKGSGVGSPRNHTSYVVRVGKKYYWPRVSAIAESYDTTPHT